MAGESQTTSVLNGTLETILKLLNIHNIQNWFIGYGTLLGIIRNNSCIDGDDDVDIVIDCLNYDKLKEIMIDNGFTIEYGYDINKSKNILKTKNSNGCCSVDFYMASVDEKGNFHDKWENVIWSECYENDNLIERMWNNNKLYIPHNYETKLINRYGLDWKTPRKTKGVDPRKHII